MVGLLGLLLVACGGPSTSPPSDAAPAQLALPPPGQPRVAADASALPAALVCPDGQRGNQGCFRAFPAGTLLLGAQATDPSAPGYDPAARPEEAPPHRVHLPTFWLQSQEVSVSQLDACVGNGWCDGADRATPDPAAPRATDDPVTGISWAGAQRYCAWLGGRLPTEAEWERAARGEEGRRFPWGDAPQCPARRPDEVRAQGAAVESVMHVCDSVVATLEAGRPAGEVKALLGRVRGAVTTSDLAAACMDLHGATADTIATRLDALVAAHAPTGDLRCPYDGPSSLSDLRDGTPEKVYGLGGNVSEWTFDRWGPYTAADADDPQGPAEGDDHVVRGGSWTMDDPLALRAAARAPLPGDARLPDVGFRCAWRPR